MTCWKRSRKKFSSSYHDHLLASELSFEADDRRFGARSWAAHNETPTVTEAAPLPDVQSRGDLRSLNIDKVGVTQLPFPFRFDAGSGPATEPQHTNGLIDLFVSLPASQKGTHMSRFVQVLRDWERPLSYSGLIELCHALRERLDSSRAFGTLRFPYFVRRKAPVTGEAGMLQLQVELEAAVGERDELTVTVSGPATSLCPCSKEISQYGAHNQRCELRTCVRFQPGHEVSVAELFEIMEHSASNAVYPTLKRPDEKHVTEAAYDNPKFVEDIVRDMATALKDDSRIAWFRCSSENFESIHQHNAFAQIEWP